LGLANEFLLKQVNDEIKSVRNTGVQSETAMRARTHKRLEQLRDTTLALKLILVQLDNEDDAYLVFETLNTRGKDLTTSDLLKNHLARLLRASNARGDSVRVKWESVIENIKAIELDDVSVDEFLYHYWLAKNDFTKARNIFKAAKKVIDKKAVAAKTLDELYSYSTIYRNLFRSNLRKWRNDELKIKNSIEVVINRFRVRQPLPLILTALSKYEERTLSKAELERLLYAIEMFTFVHTGLMNARSTGGVLQMYSFHARELSRSTAPTRRERTIDELVKKLQLKIPTKEPFLKKFSELNYSDTFPSEKRLVQFALNKLMEHIAPSVALDPAAMSIEHIAAQSDVAFPSEIIASIGNLWILNTRFNNSLDNMPVKKKLTEYRNADMPSDAVLKESEDWTAEVVQKRSLHLAELMWVAVEAAFK
jgi:tetratricopeptide (TPR) repeat protein